MILEKDVAATVTQYLLLRGWYVVRTEANAVTRGRGNGGIVPRGEPDARAFKNNRALHIEFKRPKAKPTAEQLQRHEYLKTFGIKVYIITSLEEAQKMLEQEG